jgi:hypothetical protein
MSLLEVNTLEWRSASTLEDWCAVLPPSCLAIDHEGGQVGDKIYEIKSSVIPSAIGKIAQTGAYRFRGRILCYWDDALRK